VGWLQATDGAKYGLECVAFAFHPRGHAILPVAGDKAGVGQKRFYQRLIAKADRRFDGHLSKLGR
jgi:hypothetical protein